MTESSAFNVDDEYTGRKRVGLGLGPFAFVIVVVLQIAAFATVIIHYRQKGEYPTGLP